MGLPILGNPACCCGDACENRICVSAWSIGAYCDLANRPYGPDPCVPPTPIPGAIAVAAVTIERIYTDPTTHLDVVEAYATTETGEDGSVCVDIPTTVADPGSAPTVEPSGGGASGGTLTIGTYQSLYQYITHYGQTAPSPLSPEFQVGIPAPGQYPVLVPPDVLAPVPGSTGLLQVGTYYAKVLYKDAAGNHNNPTTASAPIVAAALGDIPRLAVPSLSLRANAVACDLYLATTLTGTYRLYRAGVTSTALVLLDAAFDPAAATAPGTNTSLNNIPRVTFVPGGAGVIATRVYALAAGGGATSGRYRSPAGNTSPIGLTGAFTAASWGSTNTTGLGRFRIKVHPIGANTQSGEVTVAGTCNTYTTGFAFCVFRTEVTVSPGFDTMTCSSPNACTDESGAAAMTMDASGASGIVGICHPGVPCPRNSGVETVWCGGLLGSLSNPPNTTCVIAKAGYYSRTICYPAPCGYPAVDTAVSTTLYPVADWVQVPHCVGACDPPSVRPRNLLPKTLHLSFTGPEGLTGSTGPVAVTLFYEPTLSDEVNGPVVFRSACLAGHGWGICDLNNPIVDGVFSQHCYQHGSCPTDPCGTNPLLFGCEPFDAMSDVLTGYLDGGRVPYQSTRVTLSVTCQPPGLAGTVTWKNYWAPECPDAPGEDVPVPACDGGATFALWSDYPACCPCGEAGDISKFFYNDMYGTKSGSTTVQDIDSDYVVDFSGSAGGDAYTDNNCEDNPHHRPAYAAIVTE